MVHNKRIRRITAILLTLAVVLGGVILPEKTARAAGTLSVQYSAHVEKIGWQDEVADGRVAGTIGQAKRVEAFRIRVTGDANLGISYSAHVQKIGWQTEVSDGGIAGTTGLARRVEALKMHLTGADADQFDLYYCVHVQSIGWMDWVKNGEVAGTTGRGLRMEAAAIQILPKGSPAPVNLKNKNYSGVSLSFRTHIQSYGWMSWAKSGSSSGAAGQGKRLEAFEMSLRKGDFSGSISYRAHVQSIGWQDWVEDGQGAGTTGQAKRVEAMQARLTGELADFFDLYYRAYVEEYGWTGWAMNGEECGSTGISYRMEAMEVKLVKKGDPAPARGGTLLYKVKKPKPVTPSYSPEVQDMINRAQGYKSSTGYLIMISRKAHKVVVLSGSAGNWKAIRVHDCSVGAPNSPTITGTYRMGAKILHFGDEKGYRCWYASQILGNYLMHSGTYGVTPAPTRVLDNRMNMDISHGCVRMELENAKWIYYNVPSGTTIHID